jgi:hypothetical protein
MHQNHEPREPYSLCDTGATLPCGPTAFLKEKIKRKNLREGVKVATFPSFLSP